MSRDRPHEREARNGERTRRDRGREGCSDLTSTAFRRPQSPLATLGESPKTPVVLNAQTNAQVNAHGKEEDR